MYKILDLAEGQLVDTYYKDGNLRHFHFIRIPDALQYIRHYVKTNKAAAGRRVYEYEVVEV